MKLKTPTPELLTGWTVDQLKKVRDNAEKYNEAETVALCEAEIAKRKPASVKKVGGSITPHKGEAVIGFHFVCANEQGVIRNSDGTAWSGTWVVAQNRAEAAAKAGSYIALHAKKTELSYLQGIVRAFRKSGREQSYAEGQEVQTEYGIDFLFELTDHPYSWVGDGSGEKGYAWGQKTDPSEPNQ